MANKEYIEREAVRKAIIFPLCGYVNLTDNREIREKFENIPAADVQPVLHGRWIFETDERHPWCKKAICSNCNKVATVKDNLFIDTMQEYFITKNSFCRNCGADMRDNKTAIS